MTQQEFFDRTMVTVNEQEFLAIHIVYMTSDLDKDAFCKAWCKMNAARVADAKRIAKAKQAHHKFIEGLFNLKNALRAEMDACITANHDYNAAPDYDKLTKRDKALLAEADITTSEFSYVDYQLHPKSYGTIVMDIHEYIEKNASCDNIH